MEANDGDEEDDDVDGLSVLALVLALVLLWLRKSTLRVSGSDCLTFKVAM